MEDLFTFVGALVLAVIGSVLSLSGALPLGGVLMAVVGVAALADFAVVMWSRSAIRADEIELEAARAPAEPPRNRRIVR